MLILFYHIRLCVVLYSSNTFTLHTIFHLQEASLRCIRDIIKAHCLPCLRTVHLAQCAPPVQRTGSISIPALVYGGLLSPHLLYGCDCESGCDSWRSSWPVHGDLLHSLSPGSRDREAQDTERKLDSPSWWWVRTIFPVFQNNVFSQSITIFQMIKICQKQVYSYGYELSSASWASFSSAPFSQFCNPHSCNPPLVLY